MEFFSVTSVFRVGLKKSGNSRESEKSGDFACGLKGIVENFFRSVFRACLKKKWGFSHESEGKLWKKVAWKSQNEYTEFTRFFFSHRNAWTKNRLEGVKHRKATVRLYPDDQRGFNGTRKKPAAVESSSDEEEEILLVHRAPIPARKSAAAVE